MNTCYPEQILILCDVPLTHTADNGYRCSDITCPCNEQEAPHTPLHTSASYLDCSCQRCTFVREVMAGGEL